MDRDTKTSEIISLCSRVIQDLDTHLVPVEAIVNRAHHAAELAGRKNMAFALYCESVGYPKPGGPHDWFLRGTGRWNEEKGTYIATPAGLISQNIPQMEAKVASLSMSRITATPKNADLIDLEIRKLHDSVRTSRRILHLVRGLIYRFAVGLRSELLFSKRAGDVFSRFQERVDARLKSDAADVTARLPAISERLSAGDPEAIAHALQSCRRMIEAFADATAPAQRDPIVVKGKEFRGNRHDTKDRVRSYILAQTSSESRYERLNKNMSQLWDRVSTGVHGDVSRLEAEALMLNTYLLLGELIELS